jgi:hypothetical protein
VRVSLKSVAGVDAVDVSLDKGLASVKMKPGNAATFKQLQEAITKNGFTMKPSNVNVVGKIVIIKGQPKVQVSGSNDLVNLIPDGSPATNVNAMADKRVIVDGTLEEAAKGQTPDTIRYRTVTEDK